jgi:fructokinase|tara:strand:+ start:21 stop:878 length:858 start_codon:yes stop_codon:yes gene_type:complete
MQIGIDLGATKIEYVILEENGNEILREREISPTDYKSTINSIEKIVIKLEKKFNKKFEVGICHPGSISNDSGLLKNVPNSPWMNDKPFNLDISKKLNRNVICENDANCFALSEAIDGSAKHYSIVFGIILGSGCGGGVVVNKKILRGANNLSGEWGKIKYKNEDIESFLSGTSISRRFENLFNKKKNADEIFKLYRNNDIEAEKIINQYKNNLAETLAIIINILDPDAIVFGGGVSNEITFLDNIKKLTETILNEHKINTAFIKPMYGDSSGVRGAARLGRKINY